MDVKGRSGSISINMPELVSVEPGRFTGSTGSGSRSVSGAASTTTSTTASTTTSTTTTSTSGPSKPVSLPRDRWTIAKSYVPVAKQLFISGLSWGVRSTASAKIAECASCMGYSGETAKYIGEVVSGIGVAVSHLVVSSGLRTLQDKLGIGEAVPINQNKFKLGQSVVLLGNLAAVAKGKFGHEFPLLTTMGLSAVSGAGSLFVAVTGANLLGMEMKATKPSSEPVGQRLIKGVVVGGATGAIGAQIGFGTDSAEHAAAAAVSHRTPFIVLREIADALFPPAKKPPGKSDGSDAAPLISDEEVLPEIPKLIVLVSEPSDDDVEDEAPSRIDDSFEPVSEDERMPPLLTGQLEPNTGEATYSDDESPTVQGLSRSEIPDSPRPSRNSLSATDFGTPDEGNKEG